MDGVRNLATASVLTMEVPIDLAHLANENIVD